MMGVIQIALILLTLLGVGIIVFTKNIVHAAYALCLSLMGIAGIYVVLLSELLAVVQIMIYAGGVVILLVFGVMMTNRLKGEKVLTGSRNSIVGAAISLSLFSFLAWVISNSSFSPAKVKNQDQVKSIGVSFLTDHIVAFELVAFVLLVALVGAAYLAKTAADE
ncbi:MAG: NADH-quinone oxidoreductase subunit J [Ekhidna sp.]